MRSLSNISVAEYRRVLRYLGLTCMRTNGGHESWMRPGLLRPIVFQTHIDPVPEFILRNGLRSLGLGRDEFLALLERS